MGTTPRFGLTLMATSSLNKEVIFNEALIMLDRMTSPAVNSATITAPPGSPAVGDTYRVPPGATGAWSGQQEKLAIWVGAWRFIEAVPGLMIYAADSDSYWRFLHTSDAFEQTDLMVTSLGAIPDVDLYGLEDGDHLVYDTPSSLWIPKSAKPIYVPITTSTALNSAVFRGNVILRCDSGSDMTLTVPDGLNAKFSATIIRVGAGGVTIAAGGVTSIRSADNKLKLRERYSSAALVPDSAANNFFLVGDIAT